MATQRHDGRSVPAVLAAVLVGGLALGGAAPAAAQDAPTAPESSQLAFTGALDVASTYMFRGILQDDAGVITWPAAALDFALFEGDGAVRSLKASVGTWNSLHSGPTGGGGPSGKLWYESDFYTGVTLGLPGGVSAGAVYTAYTSPNATFGTVKEIALKVAVDDSGPLGRAALAPYALVAFELDGQADGGAATGTYLELGVAPGTPVLPEKLAIAFPVKVGLSLGDYYEGPAGDSAFGYLDVGAIASAPLAFIPSPLGSWNVHGGVNAMRLGESVAHLNRGGRSKVIFSLGVGLSY